MLRLILLLLGVCYASALLTHDDNDSVCKCPVSYVEAEKSGRPCDSLFKFPSERCLQCVMVCKDKPSWKDAKCDKTKESHVCTSNSSSASGSSHSSSASRGGSSVSHSSSSRSGSSSHSDSSGSHSSSSRSGSSGSSSRSGSSSNNGSSGSRSNSSQSGSSHSSGSNLPRSGIFRQRLIPKPLISQRFFLNLQSFPNKGTQLIRWIQVVLCLLRQQIR